MYCREVMACDGMDVREAWCVSSRGEGDEVGRCGGFTVGCVLSDGCWVSVAVCVGASVCPAREVQLMAWDDMYVCGMKCVACGVECDGV